MSARRNKKKKCFGMAKKYVKKKREIHIKIRLYK